MWISIAALALLLFAGDAYSQNSANQGSDSTGRTVLPSEMKSEKQPEGCSESSAGTSGTETKSAKQAQGCTGPLQTGSGGAAARSPQGETPPAMQAAPDDSSKTIVDPK
jgi:hypothetical protein